MRADFYHRCVAYPQLRTLMADQQFLVGPLGADGLREVIERPAWRAGLELQAWLVQTILTDVADCQLTRGLSARELGTYTAAQVSGGLVGCALANAMFAVALTPASTVRATPSL
ncbi:MAG: hypothetical protein ACRD0K_03585, partial [Egibacteraceae bacterium]